MYCILVAGMPASGKSTVARYLSEQMKIPMVSKDNLKEILGEVRLELNNLE